MTTIAFLGTGRLGSGMIENLCRSGHAVTVWNRTESKARALEPLGATVAPTPAAAVAGADRVHMAIFDDASVDTALQQIAPALKTGALVVDHTTTGLVQTAARSALAAKHGMKFLHAPVFMGPQSCRDATGLMLAAGPRAVFEEAQPALASMTDEVWYLGERADLAAAMKLIGNSMLVAMSGAIADVLSIAKESGIEAAQALEVFTKFHVENVIGLRGGKMATHDYSTNFTMNMSRKDLRLMIEAAGGQELIVLPRMAERMDAAIAAGYGESDMAAIVEIAKH